MRTGERYVVVDLHGPGVDVAIESLSGPEWRRRFVGLPQVWRLSYRIAYPMSWSWRRPFDFSGRVKLTGTIPDVRGRLVCDITPRRTVIAVEAA